jgi:ArsR family transcriptional regulator
MSGGTGKAPNLDQEILIDQVFLITSPCRGWIGRCAFSFRQWARPLSRMSHCLFVGAVPVVMTAEVLNEQQARQLLKALADPLRLDLVQALSSGERCVCDLVSDLNLAQSRLSFHLKVMREAGLIDAREEGRWVYYRLRAGALEQLQAWLAALAAGCQAPARCCS